MKRLGFTLAEVLITLAIIGVVAAISIPSVISNSQQQEFKTGLRKAVSVLNSAITMNMAIDGESPYDNGDLYNYLQRHMSIIKSTYSLPWKAIYQGHGNLHGTTNNGAFYTTDGMRFEFDDWRVVSQNGNPNNQSGLKLHESNIAACFASISTGSFTVEEGNQVVEACGGCGSYGLNHNPNNTTKPPCAILVDVNGDRKPTPQRSASTKEECEQDPICSQNQKYWVPTLESNRVSDIFVILITDDRAIPYGVVAQRAMYQAQAKK